MYRATTFRPILQKSPLHDADCFSYRIAQAGPAGNSVANGPSGIAQQLRRSEEQNLSHLDPMSLDDFLFYGNAPTPPGHDQGYSPADDMHGFGPDAHASAIPIKSRKDPFERFSPQSVPAPLRDQDEFDYVTRHHRKTSIDVRPVSRRPSLKMLDGDRVLILRLRICRLCLFRR